MEIFPNKSVIFWKKHFIIHYLSLYQIPPLVQKLQKEATTVCPKLELKLSETGLSVLLYCYSFIKKQYQLLLYFD